MSLSAQIIALNNKTNGKDKIYRTVQYFCKVSWYVLWKTKSNKEYIEILKRLESTMSNTRKILRLGKSHDMLDSALKSIHLDDYFLRCVLTCSSLNQACYLVMDNLLWLHSIGIVDLKHRASKINEWSNKFWLFSTLLYLARDLHDFLTLVQNEDAKKNSKFDPTSRYMLDEASGVYKSSSSTSTNPRRKFLTRTFIIVRLILMNKKNHPLLLDTIKNMFDVMLPLASLDFIKLSPGTQGICGLVSSLISLLIVWDSKYKLTP